MVEYKSIPGYEKIYEAGTDGTIWTCEGKVTHRRLSDGTIQKRVWKRRKLKPKAERRNRSNHSDLRVDLWKNSRHTTFLVSRLIASTFISNPFNKPCINHIDGEPLHNNVENLEWVTYSENVNHAMNTGLIDTSIHVKVVNKVNHTERTFRSLAQASNSIGKSQSYISQQIIDGKFENDKYKFILDRRQLCTIRFQMN